MHVRRALRRAILCQQVAMRRRHVSFTVATDHRIDLTNESTFAATAPCQRPNTAAQNSHKSSRSNCSECNSVLQLSAAVKLRMCAKYKIGRAAVLDHDTLGLPVEPEV